MLCFKTVGMLPQQERNQKMFRFFVLLLLALNLAVPALAAPQVVVEQLRYNFGEVVQGELVEFIFRFRNAGDEILELGKVHSSCGCTAALLSTRRIAPGDIGELNARFDSSNFRGEVHKSITLETNDPRHQQVIFGLEGKVRPELLVQPERVNWGRSVAGQQLEAVITILNQGEAPVNLQPPQTTNASLTAELSVRQLPPGGQAEVRVRGKLAAEMERLSGYVIIPTDLPNVPQIRVPVSVRLAK
jgi:hypothetical protein